MRWAEAWTSLTTRVGARGLPMREFMVDANDGIIATAGIVEGFAGAGVGETAIIIAGASATIAGAIALGGVKYAEVAAERDETLSVIQEEQRQLARAPDEEQAELAAYYEEKGLAPELAREVAEQLTRRNALAAHVDAEYGLDVARIVRPLPVAILAAIGFASGAAIPLVAAVLAPDAVRGLITFVAVIVSLTLTSIVQAQAGRTSVGRTVARTVIIGISAMAITYVVGIAFQR